ncbi:preprotein translocase subunit SecE [Aerosticca soli]|jgi:preprotein translocase subunit SecE|uniref:Protein translocase subunit SecE n=1 Tax=Aerosticca soli TaxID=2010829 RepID=A0A2Z6E7P6_9GAMM|nr:preprotein translocase subunit SecE [Aerosticca soli]BBD80684.1 preprotein translocase subunit SecE [Aerosticca soli]
MNTKAEQPKGAGGADTAKLVLAFLVLAAGIFAYSWLGSGDRLSPAVRMLIVLVALVASLGIAAFTAVGRRVRGFLIESQYELRKVVWPTREETLKTTGVIIVVVVILSLLLGLIDLVLKAVVLDWLLKL